jgi:hypothetical protein
VGEMEALRLNPQYCPPRRENYNNLAVKELIVKIKYSGTFREDQERLFSP